jgi:hypothetical protein
MIKLSFPELRQAMSTPIANRGQQVQDQQSGIVTVTPTSTAPSTMSATTSNAG